MPERGPVFFRFFHLPFRQQRQVAEITATYLWIELMLQLFPFSRFLNRPLKKTERILPRETLLEINRLAEAVLRVFPNGTTCLKKCLLLKTLFRRRGMEFELKIGVRKENGRLDAHAWLERNGTPFFHSPHPPDTFTPLFPKKSPDGNRKMLPATLEEQS